jgi:hypothetical protein
VRGLSSTMARMAIFRHAKTVAGGSSAALPERRSNVIAA